MSYPKNIPSNGGAFATIEIDYWERNWKHEVSLRPLSQLNVFNRDAIALLTQALRSSTNPVIVEIGFVPGKYLQFFEKRFNAECHGYDYSETGCRKASQFLSEQCSSVQVHHQDVLVELPKILNQAQLVYSIGVVEHFDDPLGMIRAHLAPLSESGVAIIILPNYQGLNQWFQRRLDSNNLDIHNLDSMTSSYWEKYAYEFPEFEFSIQLFGRLNPWMFSFWSFGKIGKFLQLALNFGSLLLPKRLRLWESMFVVEIRRK